MANEQNLSPQGYNINEAPYNTNPSTWEGGGSGGGGASLPDGGTTGQVLTKRSDNDGDADWQDIPSEANSLAWVDRDSYPNLDSPINSYNQIWRTNAELQPWKQDEYEVALPYDVMEIDGVRGNTVTDDQSGSTISVEIVPVASPYEIWDDQTETQKKYGLMQQNSTINFGVGSLMQSSDEKFLSVRGKSNDNIEVVSVYIENENIDMGWNGISVNYSITGTGTLFYNSADGAGYEKQFTLEIRGFIPATITREYKKLVAI